MSEPNGDGVSDEEPLTITLPAHIAARLRRIAAENYLSGERLARYIVIRGVLNDPNPITKSEHTALRQDNWRRLKALLPRFLGGHAGDA